MKRFVQASIAAAAVSLAAGSALPAAAADLGGWGRGSIKDDMIAPPRSAAGPCYFRGDVGYSFATDPNMSWSAWNGSNNYDLRVTKTHSDNTWTGGVGAGCGSGSRGFRYEAMLGYHGQRGVHGTTAPYAINIGGPLASSLISSAITTYTGMVNGYWDMGNFRGLVPYVGLGVGVAYHQVDDYQIAASPNFPTVPWKVGGNNDMTLAWSAMAGFGYQLSDRAILDVGYRYIDFGRATTARHDVFAQGVLSRLNVDDFGAHEIKVGLRYHFGGDSCCMAPPMSLK